ncbi:hypothetical protein [Tenacibaculum amylolyticum]|uniref:hypothetical protein n=1 Tax=Tenacibaculum amylolyticum TaxID=104269 RepID=UPI0038946A46
MNAIYTKKKLFETYYYLNDGEMRYAINTIIAENRKIPLDIAKFKKKLRPKEVQAFLKEFDLI